MNGQLAQTICLAAHASEWLQAASAEPLRLDANSTFQYVGSLRFIWEQPPRATTEANDVGNWVVQLRERGIERVWLIVLPPSGPLADRHLASVTGDGTWAMLATAGERQELWRGSWVVGDRDAVDSKIWAVTHAGAPIAGIEASAPSITDAQERLLRALAAIRDFASVHDLGFWAEWFSAAIAKSQATEPAPRFHSDMLPSTGYREEARRLLAIAVGSWVWGGMGSWNDLAVAYDENAAQYKELSRRLYTSMMTAFLACVNSPLLT